MPLQKRPFQLAKNAEKYAIITLIFEKIFSPKNPHIGEGLRHPSPDPTPKGGTQTVKCLGHRAPQYLNPALAETLSTLKHCIQLM